MAEQKTQPSTKVSTKEFLSNAVQALVSLKTKIEADEAELAALRKYKADAEKK